ncbi:MAG: S-methyl-5-thioribose-1-phosphate isomerase [Bacteroidales bacterium]|nr:S-methyl-5-thioribose-1-phosphate isomerase [Bacteroidales bacterium]
MLVNGIHYRTIWVDENSEELICIIDQTRLPFEFVIKKIDCYQDMIKAIVDMEVRGAGLIGAASAFAVYLAVLRAPKDDAQFDAYIKEVASKIKSSRPTAINLEWATDRMLQAIQNTGSSVQRIKIALDQAIKIADEDSEFGRMIGIHGLPLIEKISKKNGDVVNILTHCNAGWLALVDYGTALSPIYAAHEKGIKVHVWVDETRPRNQGASLTAWELNAAGIPHTVIADNAGGLLMQNGKVDLVIVGSDRTTHTGDVCNKIGTYLKALAANDNNIPFYAAVYSSSFDWTIKDGLKDIPIEQRNGDELRYIKGLDNTSKIKEVCIIPSSSPVSNYAFDVTPARLITALITERGICNANPESIAVLFPEKVKNNRK